MKGKINHHHSTRSIRVGRGVRHEAAAVQTMAPQQDDRPDEALCPPSSESSEEDASSVEREGLDTLLKKDAYRIHITDQELPREPTTEETKPRKSCCCGPKLRCFWGSLLIFIGVGTIFYTPLDFLMRERLKMMPGLPSFEWWFKPDNDPIIRFFLFNVTNSEDFMSGKDSVLKFEEIGPYVYREKLVHSNPIFNDNDTLTYTSTRSLEFLPELNTHNDMNATVYQPNYFLLGIVSYLRDDFFQKISFKAFGRSLLKQEVILKDTVYNFLWDNSNPYLRLAKIFAPSMVPSENVGILHTMYRDFVATSTVYIGPKWGNEIFFGLDKFEGKETLPGYGDEGCPLTLKNASEGALYPQGLTKNTTLRYWRQSVCNVVHLPFEDEEMYNGVLGYRFIVPLNTYYRKNNSELDCHMGNPVLPNGFNDLSKCYNNLPVAVSLPHFTGVDPVHLGNIEGFHPDYEKYKSNALIEPITGIPLRSKALSQTNFVMGKLSGFSEDIQRFNNMILPMFWMEIKQSELLDRVWILIKLLVIYIPWIQAIMSGTFILIGLYLIWKFYRTNNPTTVSFFNQNRIIGNLAKKTILGEGKNQKLSVISIR